MCHFLLSIVIIIIIIIIIAWPAERTLSYRQMGEGHQTIDNLYRHMGMKHTKKKQQAWDFPYSQNNLLALVSNPNHLVYLLRATWQYTSNRLHYKPSCLCGQFCFCFCFFLSLFDICIHSL